MYHELPAPDAKEPVSVVDAIDRRASRRAFGDDPLELADVATLLWATQGITHERDGVEMRAAPSAGATYPLSALLEVAGDGIPALTAGLYGYTPGEHALERRIDGSIREALVAAALEQPVVSRGAATIVLVADYKRTCREYPEHGERYVHMEAGHAAQNAQLSCEGRGLSTCPVGAFRDDEVARVLELPEGLDPLYLLPVGHRA